MKTLKKEHGGKREGSGRKPKEPAVVMRIPVSKVNAVKKILQTRTRKKRPNRSENGNNLE
jgi:hypothetical protein